MIILPVTESTTKNGRKCRFSNKQTLATGILLRVSYIFVAAGAKTEPVSAKTTINCINACFVLKFPEKIELKGGPDSGTELKCLITRDVCTTVAPLAYNYACRICVFLPVCR